MKYINRGEGKMSKIQMKRLSLILLVTLLMGGFIISMVNASAPGLSVHVNPSSGTVPTNVLVYGWGASPCGNVEIWWDADGDPNKLDVLLGIAEANRDGYYEIWVTIPEAFCGAHDITAWDNATGNSAGTKFTVKSLITLNPSSGPVGTEVTVTGTGFKPNVQIDITYDGKKVASTMTNDVGSFIVTFTVPESEYGSHYVEATDRSEGPCGREGEFFRVEPQIVLNPTQGPCETEVVITGTGFDACDWVAISFECCRGCAWWWYEVTETNDKGSFTYTFTIPCTLPLDEEECCTVCPGVWIIDAATSEAYAEAEFIVTPWFTIDPVIGPVGTEVTARGYGFEAETVDIVFEAYPKDITVKEDVCVDQNGNFVTTFTVPEVVEGCYRVSANGVKATTECCEELCFEVIPWIWITPSEGNVGDTVTVVGKGWDAFRNLDIIYGGIANCRHPLPLENMIGPHMAIWWVWEKTPECCNIMGVLQPSGWALVAEAFTNEKGSFEVTFEVPESPGGFHPIYAGQCISTGCPSKISKNVPVFRVKPKIWIEGHEGTSEGLSGEYVTLYGTGFSYVEAWFMFNCYPKYEFNLYFRVGAFVLDFDSNKQWINEFNFIMNNEYSEGWQEMYWVWLRWIMDGCCEPCPLFPEGYLPLYLNLNGTISHGYWWRWLWLAFYHENLPFSEAMMDDMTFKGTPFLKVPVLQPGEKEVLAYYCGLEFSLSFDPEDIRFVPFEELPTEVYGLIDGIPALLVNPIRDPMGLLFGVDDCVDVEVYFGKIYDDAASTVFTIKKPQVESDPAGTEELLSRLDELEARITSVVEDAEGNILAEIETTVGTIKTELSALDAKLTGLIRDTEGNILAEIETTLGVIRTDLANLDASISEINGKIVTIETSLGSIQTSLEIINAKLVSFEGDLATISTDIGEFSVSLEDINTKIAVINGNIAKIETNVGTIMGLVTSIDQNTVQIQTDIGTITTTLSEIKNDTGLQPATIGLSMLGAIAAIAAAVMILRKVYLK